MLNSKAHRELREKCNGIDLSQFSMLTSTQFEYLLGELRDGPYENVLDLGCGIGRVAAEVQNRLQCQMSAIDLNEDCLEIGRAQYGQSVRFSCVDYDIWRPEEEYDVIYCVDSLYFTKNLSTLIEKLYNCLKSDGRLTIFWSTVEDGKTSKNELKFDERKLEHVLRQKCYNFKKVDFTDEEIEFWNKSYTVLRELEKEFRAENELEYFELFSKETQAMYDSIPSGRVSRFCYTIQKAKSNQSLVVTPLAGARAVPQL